VGNQQPSVSCNNIITSIEYAEERGSILITFLAPRNAQDFQSGNKRILTNIFGPLILLTASLFRIQYRFGSLI